MPGYAADPWDVLGKSKEASVWIFVYFFPFDGGASNELVLKDLLVIVIVRRSTRLSISVHNFKYTFFFHNHIYHLIAQQKKIKK